MGVVIDIKVAQNGRMVLPRSVREALGMENGGIVVLSMEGNEVRLSSIRQSIKRAQQLYRQHVTDDLPVDEFIQERRADAAREERS
ncbi:MAG: AbrB/MazE/SpoVT family DNA-binding domain-containing protein [Sphingomonadaceae bacterium]